MIERQYLALKFHGTLYYYLALYIREYINHAFLGCQVVALYGFMAKVIYISTTFCSILGFILSK